VKVKFSLFILAIGISIQAISQILTSSNLPIIIIQTDNNGGIPDQPRVFATMKVIDKGSGVRNSINDQNNISALTYNGRIEIEVRGSSSQALDKKQYSFTTLLPDNISKNNVPLLGMPIQNDWILSGLAFDPSYIRDHLSFTLSRKIGEYAPRSVYCELVINGDYRGLYMMVEKIKIDDERVDVLKMSSLDNTIPDITGGYITKADKVADQDQPAWQMSSYLGTNDVSFIHESPDNATITSQQSQYIQSQFEQLRTTAQFGNTSITSGYPSVIDIPSFVHFMIINELSANVDAYQFSTFFHKDKNGKLRAGPIWDLNLTYGNDLFMWGYDRSKTDTWQFDNGDNIGARFWKDLFINSTFKCHLSRRWNGLTQLGKPLHLASINMLIDQTVTTISEAVVRNEARWGIGNHPTFITNIKSFLEARAVWMTTGFGPFSTCSNIQTPPLVITKINYHPSTSTEFPNSNDQEFIEITNNGNEPVSTAGFYFAGTGFVYQFPNSLVLNPHEIFQLASKPGLFYSQHGYYPLGHFSRNLSNVGQRVTLADAFGNVIDQVEYSSLPPWPEVSANGSYLKLKSPELDNSLASNWEASTESISSTILISGIEDNPKTKIDVFPNPFENLIAVSADAPMLSILLRDLQGRVIMSISPNSTSASLDLSHFPNGIFIMSISSSNEVTVKKLFKK
jgi:CotH kinase protein/Lamin Tail Domain/Secretion system C-terminal sorting domain